MNYLNPFRPQVEQTPGRPDPTSQDAFDLEAAELRADPRYLPGVDDYTGPGCCGGHGCDDGRTDESDDEEG